MAHEAFYNREILKASFEELKEFIGWFNTRYGYFPVIVGGWAVYSHCSHMMSRDIDVVFPSMEIRDVTLNRYFMAHGFELKGLFSKRYVKEIQTSMGLEEILIDACTYEDISRCNFNPDIEMPWSFLQNQDILIKMNIDDLQLYVPNINALLMMKSKALLDREHLLRETGDVAQAAYLESKVWKDARDIRELIKNGADAREVKEIARKFGFDEYIDLAMERAALILK